MPGGWNAGYSEKLYAGLAANDPPDLFIIRIADLPEFLSKDLLLDLKPYVDRDSYDLNEFPALAIESYTHDGGIYGMPDNVASVAMFCNQDMIEEAGAQVPTNQWDDPGWTVDDFFNMCEAVTQRDANGDTTQYAYQVTGWSVIWQIWVRIFGAPACGRSVLSHRVHLERTRCRGRPAVLRRPDPQVRGLPRASMSCRTWVLSN